MGNKVGAAVSDLSKGIGLPFEGNVELQLKVEHSESATRKMMRLGVSNDIIGQLRLPVAQLPIPIRKPVPVNSAAVEGYVEEMDYEATYPEPITENDPWGAEPVFRAWFPLEPPGGPEKELGGEGGFGGGGGGGDTGVDYMVVHGRTDDEADWPMVMVDSDLDGRGGGRREKKKRFSAARGRIGDAMGDMMGEFTGKKKQKGKEGKGPV